MYELRFMKPAERYFKKLKEKGLKTAYREALDRIATDPYIGEPKVGEFIVWTFITTRQTTRSPIAFTRITGSSSLLSSRAQERIFTMS